MITRYSVNSIEQIWSDDNKMRTWWLVELAILKAWAALNVISKQELLKIENSVKLSHSRMLELEQETKHDVVAFTRMISESLGNESRWVHLGVTSTDIVDTAQNWLIKQSLSIVMKELEQLNGILMKLALQHKKTLIMGRSHGIFGEPTSLGLKFLLWNAEIKRQIKRINLAKEDVCVTKISGSMGNFANITIEVENLVATTLQMPVDLLSTQVSQRDRMAGLVMSFANLASTFEKMASDLRLYNRSDVNEICEGFSVKQKGSSSMPHKKNPISLENISGLVRIIRAYVIPALENNILWHERDISHSSVERIMLPDCLHLVVYITKRFTNVLQHLFINESQMMLNIQQAHNIFYSQPILTEIIKTTQFTREEVYDFIQTNALKAMRDNVDFLVLLKQQGIKKYISLKKLDELCQLDYFLNSVDQIYARFSKADTI